VDLVADVCDEVVDVAVGFAFLAEEVKGFLAHRGEIEAEACQDVASCVAANAVRLLEGILADVALD
jgi:hypothetical protein